MNGKERVKYALSHREPDTVPIGESPWATTIRRWQNEGIPKQMSVKDYFNFDMSWPFLDASPQYPIEIVDEGEDYVVERNTFGETVKYFKDHMTTPYVSDSPIKNKNDWEELKERLTIGNSRLISLKELFFTREDDFISQEETKKNFMEYKIKGRFVCPLVLVGFDMIQRYVGMERLLILFVTDPKWVKDMIMTHAKFVIELYQYFIDNGIKFDGAFLANDMGYRNSTLFSPNLYKELILPADKLVCEYFHSMDMPVILHSDGDLRKIIPNIIEAGFDCLQPLEVKANMDIRDLKKNYGNELAFMGGIDTRLMSHNNPSKIEEEIKNKFEIAKKGGGYIYHSDHSIPDDVSLNQFERVLDLVKKYGIY